MSTDFSEFHDELRTVARDLLGQSSPLVGDRGDASPANWFQFARAGWLGLDVPEAMGGADATFREVTVVLREMGRAATTSPYFGSIILAVGALRYVTSTDQRDDLLRRVVSGDLRLAVALATDDHLDGALTPFALQCPGGAAQLVGRGHFIPDAVEADQLLVLAVDEDGALAIIHLEDDAPGLSIEPQPVVDPTRRLAHVVADHIEVKDPAILRFRDPPEEAAQRLFDRATLAIACDSLGVAEAMLDATVAYTSTRHQFGRPVGSFQAVKHACADMLLKITVSQELLASAIEAVSVEADDAWIAVSRAKSYIGAAAVEVAGEAMQLHGGIGFTWESGIHTYLKRATLNRSLFGCPTAHRRRLAAHWFGDPLLP